MTCMLRRSLVRNEAIASLLHRRASRTIVPTLPASSRRRRGVSRATSLAAARACEAAADGEEDESADGGTDADDDAFVVIDPGLDLAAYGAAFALAL